MSGIARKMRRKNRFKAVGRGSAAVSPQFARRMPEQGEKFILAGPDWVSPAVFELEGYTGDGAAIIRFADKSAVTTDPVPSPVLPGLPERPAIIETGVSA